jgi:hypothetical protein
MHGGYREVARHRFSASESPDRRREAAGGERGGGFGGGGAARGSFRAAVGLRVLAFSFTASSVSGRCFARWEKLARCYRAPVGAIDFGAGALNWGIFSRGRF